MLALALLIVANCKKEDEAKKTPEKEVSKKSDDSTKEKTTPSDAFPAPGMVTIDQAISSMGLDAAHRLVMRAPALVDSGLVDLSLSAIPADKRANYDAFVASSGFDPVKVVTGALIFADGDIAKFETAKPTIIFGIRGGVSEKLIEEMSKDDDDDDDDDDDAKEFTAVFLAKIDAPTQAKILAELNKTKKDSSNVLHEKVGDGHVIAKVDPDAFKYAYIWAGGMVLSEAPLNKAKTTDLAGAKLLLKPTLEALAKASGAQGSSGGPALEGRGSANGTAAKFSLAITKQFVIDATVTPPANKLAEAKPILAMIQKQPEAFAAQTPPEGRELAKLFLAGTKMDVTNDSVVVHSELDLEQLKKLAKPLLESAAK